MCRSIKRLRNHNIPATYDEVNAAALQYIRKVSGYRVPSRANQEAFELAVAEVAASTERLIQLLTESRTPSPVIDSN